MAKTKYGRFSSFKAPKSVPSQNTGRSWKPSQQQEAIFKATLSDNHVVVPAGAGCGKTSTQVEAVKPLVGKAKVCCLAFNKSIADEIGTKLPAGIESKTIHALGLQCCRQNIRKLDVDRNRVKVEEDIQDLYPKTDFPKLPNESSRAHNGRYYAMVAALRKFVSMSKNYGYRHVNLDSMGLIATTYDFPIQVTEETVQQVNTLLDCSFNDTALIDFDDMIWMPVVKGWKLPKYDLVGVDEAQDLNPLRQRFIEMLADRAMIVGDEHQAIYGFCGADVDSMNTMRSILTRTRTTTGKLRKVEDLTLNITRRCPKSHVAIANSIFPGALEAAPEAPEGTVGTSHLSNLINTVQAQDFVLSRTNAPLVWFALQLVKAKRPVVILGRDFCEGLKYIIRQSGGDTQSEWISNLRNWYAEQMAKFEGESPKQVRMREMISDKYHSIISVAGECSSANSAIAQLDELFGERSFPNAVVLSSIHKAKGLEAERVFITHPHLLPHPMAKADWEIQQEMNLKYVAVTRSKSHLEWVEGDFRELNKKGF